MSFYDAAGHWLIYALVSIGILFVVGLSIISMWKSWKRGLQKGLSQEKLMTVVKASVAATIIPALAIVIGFFSLATMLGIPWPWWRLSVVGSVTYETMAADMALKAGGVDVNTATVKDFVLVMYVMSIGIIGGLCTAPFISKPIQMGAMKIKTGDKRWGALGASVFFLVILIVFVVPMFLDYSKTGLVKLLCLVTSAGITVILNVIISKTKANWFRSFVLAFSMLLAMASAVLWTKLLNV
ncbi:MAG: DUF5058 family protein [Treponema sp.]|jgi:hypothetical protein|nr:DUF5058 family protein [Treponema sp.]